ncbi:MAG: 4Fe-4S ferredoxin [Spirochaetales bacterium]|uniref:4Fe-4S ferredoxin n=1 Tax=Candidatus Thalassospirochaeta sargassi TaxID=3119039 RepID=A0AAJ1IF29_9SPIO|nr:4Fe-4S ferredoxin [Spirochaetales bacterium]
MYASRNLAKCTKDCLCLFVCPTGATDTETGQIDSSKCLDGCRLCVDACPSHAIFLVMDNYPEPEPKNSEVADKMLNFCAAKYGQEKSAEAIADSSASEAEKKLAAALKQSLRIVAEDCAREAGYMLPQCEKAQEFKAELGG